jgi:hypothetical protein
LIPNHDVVVAVRVAEGTTFPTTRGALLTLPLTDKPIAFHSHRSLAGR